MSRKQMVDLIKDFFAFLESKIKLGSKNNLLDENILAESTFREILNLVYELSYINVNVIKSNTKGIDLLDESNKKYCQVSSDKSKSKVDKTISGLPKKYNGFHLYFLFLVTECSSVKTHTYGIDKSQFNPKSDIINLSDLLSIIMDLENTKLQKVYDICRNEFYTIVDNVEMDEANLSKIIKELSKNRLNYEDKDKQSFKYESKIEFNNLDYLKKFIFKLSPFVNIVDKIFGVYDSQGSNISFSIIALISDFYDKSKAEIMSTELESTTSETLEDKIFLTTIDKTIEYINSRPECKVIPIEERMLYAKIIVIDVFLRCDIFDNPEGYEYDIKT